MFGLLALKLGPEVLRGAPAADGMPVRVLQGQARLSLPEQQVRDQDLDRAEWPGGRSRRLLTEMAVEHAVGTLGVVEATVAGLARKLGWAGPLCWQRSPRSCSRFKDLGVFNTGVRAAADPSPHRAPGEPSAGLQRRRRRDRRLLDGQREDTFRAQNRRPRPSLGPIGRRHRLLSPTGLIGQEGHAARHTRS